MLPCSGSLHELREVAPHNQTGKQGHGHRGRSQNVSHCRNITGMLGVCLPQETLSAAFTSMSGCCNNHSTRSRRPSDATTWSAFQEPLSNCIRVGNGAGKPMSYPPAALCAPRRLSFVFIVRSVASHTHQTLVEPLWVLGEDPGASTAA